MKKGDKYADVYDSPETIRQAQLDGYSLCQKQNAAPKEPPVEPNAEADQEKKGAGVKRQ